MEPQDPRVAVAFARAIVAFANAFSAWVQFSNACAEYNRNGAGQQGGAARIRHGLLPGEQGVEILEALLPPPVQSVLISASAPRRISRIRGVRTPRASPYDGEDAPVMLVPEAGAKGKAKGKGGQKDH